VDTLKRTRVPDRPHAVDHTAPPDWRGGLLTEVMRIVVEAALEAELIHHLERPSERPPTTSRANARNGYRAKTVSTTFGTVTIDAPRDRWGTFDPVAVGKWQRRVVGVDQLAVPLAARGADRSECVALLARVYRPPADLGLAGLVAAEIGSRMIPWHLRPLPPTYHALVFDGVVVRSRDGSVASTPVRSAVGVTASGRRELLALRAAPTLDSPDSWRDAVADLYDRGVRSVQTVVCPSLPDLDAIVSSAWPAAVQLDRAA
jgi:transposase-like protein